jgi:hypothetical protein
MENKKWNLIAKMFFQAPVKHKSLAANISSLRPDHYHMSIFDFLSINKQVPICRTLTSDVSQLSAAGCTKADSSIMATFRGNCAVKDKKQIREAAK